MNVTVDVVDEVASTVDDVTVVVVTFWNLSEVTLVVDGEIYSVVVVFSTLTVPPTKSTRPANICCKMNNRINDDRLCHCFNCAPCNG